MSDETTNLYIGDELFVGVTPDSFAELIQRFMGDEAADYYDWLRGLELCRTVRGGKPR